MTTPHHLFLSYARADDVAPVNDAGEGWVSAFVAELKLRHAAYSGRELRIFFDRLSIDEGRDWQLELGRGIRESALFLAFLSPNYVTSKNCLWEWEQYLRREHSSARGHDGVTPVYFIAPADLRLDEQRAIDEWLADLARKYAWFKPRPLADAQAEKRARRFIKDLNRRNKTPNLELQPWFERGPQVLRELDAAERSQAVKAAGGALSADLSALSERLAGLDRHIARRLDRIELAKAAIRNIPDGQVHFVGRHRELSKLHEIMLTGASSSGGMGRGGRGLIAATFAPGGLGKTALARQYGYAYAEFYTAGGIWEIGCEGVRELGAALLKLADSPVFVSACEDGFDVATQQPRLIARPLQLTEVERASYPLAAQAVLDYLARITKARVAVLKETLRALPERHCPIDEPPALETPRALLILDNVDQPELLSAIQLAQLPAGEWLELIVTTRLDPHSFGGGERVFAHVDVGVLPDDDALQLLAEFQPDRRFANAPETAAAREIVQALGGYTLAVELVGAYLGARAEEGYQPSHYLQRLQTEGLIRPVDPLAGEARVKAQIRHSEEVAQNHIGTLIRWSLDKLSAPARTALEYASLLMPDAIPLPWLEMLMRQRHSAELEDRPNEPPRWLAVWRELRGLRLLHPAREVEIDERRIEAVPDVVRVHRLIAEHVRVGLGPDHWQQIEQFLDRLTTQFDKQVGRGDDAWLRLQHPWLRDQLEFLFAKAPTSDGLLSSVDVAATYEGEHGSLNRAIDMTEKVLLVREKRLEQDLNPAKAARNVFSSLNTLADLLIMRGKRGDSDMAFANAQRSLQISERLLEDNPESGQAARDISVSLNRLASLLASRGQPGDAEAALKHFQRDLQISEQLLERNPDSAQAARDVSTSLNTLANLLASRGQPGDAEAALKHFQRDLQISEQLLERNPDSADAARGVFGSLSTFADFLLVRGQPGDAEAALTNAQRALQISEQLLERNPDSAQAARDVSTSLNTLANLLASRGQPGDAEAALKHFQRDLQISEQLLERNPDSADAARGVFGSLSTFADFLLVRGQPGDAEAALTNAQRALQISEQLLERNPGSAQAARDVSTSLNTLANLLASRGQPGDAEAAFELFQRDLHISKQLLERNPDSAEAARGVFASLNTFADFLMARGQPRDADAALANAQRALQISETLLERNPDSAQAARDVSNALNTLANFLAGRGQPGDAEAALKHFQRDLHISEQLLERNPDSAEAARGVFATLTTFADFLLARGQLGDADAALANAQRALQISEALLERNPDSAKAARDVFISLSNLVDISTTRGQLGDADAALANAQRALQISEQLLERNPDSAQAARDVSTSLNTLANFLAGRGQPGDAEAAFELFQRDLHISKQLLERNPDSAEAARGVFASLNTFADFLMARGQLGDADAALANAQRALQISETLLERNPYSAQAGRDVFISLSSLVDISTTRGQPADADAALSNAQRALQISETLLERNPDSAQAASDVSNALNTLANFLAGRGQPGDAEAAFELFQRDLHISEQLLERNPDSAEAARGVFVSVNNLADLLTKRGQTEDANLAFTNAQRALQISEALLERNPDSTEAARDVSTSLKTLASSLTSRGNPGDAEAALEHLRRDLQISQLLLERNPDSAEAARHVSTSLKTLASFLANRGPGDNDGRR